MNKNKTAGETLDMLAAGTDSNAFNNRRQTALHLACENNNAALVKFLLAKGAHVNIKDNECNTPLHCVTQYIIDDNEALTIVGLLVAADVDINALNDYGHTPLFNAINSYILNFYLSNNPESKTATLIEIIKLLIASGARRDLKYSNLDPLYGVHVKDHYTALELAKSWKQQEIINLLSNVPSLKNLSARIIRKIIRQKQATLEQVKK
jgi:hypothetical protein